MTTIALLGAIIHDRTLADDRVFVETSRHAVTRHHRHCGHHAHLRAAAADERLRIERDLHDGAQQRLVALAINLGIAAERTGRDDAEHSAAVMRRLAEEVERALEELRSLTHGADPPGLADHGLVVALRAAAVRNPIPTTVVGAGVGRYAPESSARCTSRPGGDAERPQARERSFRRDRGPVRRRWAGARGP